VEQLPSKAPFRKRFEDEVGQAWSAEAALGISTVNSTEQPFRIDSNAKP
jgi:hypothetical protein